MNKNSIYCLKAANDEIHIKRCPFCGYDDLFIDEIDYSNNHDIPEESVKKLGSFAFAVVCYDCNARGSEKDTKAQAIGAWNIRNKGV